MPGYYYLNGTCVKFPEMKRHFDENFNQENRNYDKTYRINFKQKQKIYDAITAQHWIASQDPCLFHWFVTLTYWGVVNQKESNHHIGDFFKKCKRHGVQSYLWVKEHTKKGSDHFHITFVAPRLPVYDKREMDNRVFTLNKAWSTSRGQYSSNAVRGSYAKNKDGSFVRRNGKKVVIYHIENLYRATKYVTKYITKSNASTIKGRRYGISNDLYFPPIRMEDPIGLCTHPVYGSRTYETRKYDFCEVGKVRSTWAKYIYDELSQIEKIV